MNKTLKRKANAIVSKYSKWLRPEELQHMYDELNSIGVSVGFIQRDFETNYNLNCYSWGGKTEVYVNGIEQDDVYFIYNVYTDLKVSQYKNEYNIYFT